MNLPSLFSSIPSPLRDELIDTFNKIEENYRAGRWEPSELNGGKFCEIVYTIITGCINNSYPKKVSKPRNFLNSCRNLENTPSTINRSLRIQIPRMLIALYEVRNNRGVGHLGGDVNPNQMDATCVLYISKWIMAELIRCFHKISTIEAEQVINSIIEKVNPFVWEVDNKYRILDPTLSMKDKTLSLLYHFNEPKKDIELYSWCEHSNYSVYKKDILQRLHDQKFIEYNKQSGDVSISPIGIEYVEKKVLLRKK